MTEQDKKDLCRIITNFREENNDLRFGQWLYNLLTLYGETFDAIYSLEGGELAQMIEGETPERWGAYCGVQKGRLTIK